MTAVSLNSNEQEILEDSVPDARVTFYLENVLDNDTEFFNALRLRHA